jgi:hypothetical protein
MDLLVVERHRDGSLHPVGGYRDDATLRRAINLVHTLRCRDGLSYRQIVARLAEEGLRVSLGSVWHYRQAWRCRYEPAEPAEADHADD